MVFSCLRLRQWPVTYLITLSDWIKSCQPGRHAVVTVCEPDWKHKWAAYKSFDETSSLTICNFCYSGTDHSKFYSNM